jgi:hypothetical protein
MTSTAPSGHAENFFPGLIRGANQGANLVRTKGALGGKSKENQRKIKGESKENQRKIKRKSKAATKGWQPPGNQGVNQGGNHPGITPLSLPPGARRRLIPSDAGTTLVFVGDGGPVPAVPGGAVIHVLTGSPRAAELS